MKWLRRNGFRFALVTGILGSLSALNFSSALAAERAEGVGAGGGGNAIVCFDNPEIVSQLKLSKIGGGGYIEDDSIPHIVSVELLDVHKARLAWMDTSGNFIQPKVIESLPEETTAQYSIRISKRFNTYFPYNGDFDPIAKPQLPVKSFPNGLAPIDDVISGEVVNSNQCIRSTIIAQFREKGGTYIAVDSRIYALPDSIFPASSRAMSFWHEDFYHDARRRGAQFSDDVQTLVGKLISEGVTVGEVKKAITAVIGGEPTDFLQALVTEFLNTLNKENLGYVVFDKAGLAFGTAAFGGEGMLTTIGWVKKILTDELTEMHEPVRKDRMRGALDFYLQNYRAKLLAHPYVPQETLDKIDGIFQAWLKDDASYPGTPSCRNDSSIPFLFIAGTYYVKCYRHFNWDRSHFFTLLNKADLNQDQIVLPSGEQLEF